MCVTNFVKRSRPITVANGSTSIVSQRLSGTFMPLLLSSNNNKNATTTSRPNNASSTVSTGAHVPSSTAPYNTYTKSAGPNNTQPLHILLAQHEQHGIQQPHHAEKKKRPKRRRKPQKPGKTAKQNDRHFVVHNYHDHANDPDDENDCTNDDTHHRKRGGVSVSFPMKLHSFLERVEGDGLGHIVRWQPHGRCFVILKPKEFADFVLPHYFSQAKLTSFQRQLNLYGFQRLTRGTDSGGYYHELFLRGKGFLCKRMLRTKVKGTKFKAASSPDQEPNFYSMVRFPFEAAA